mgnify:CR=1 FL=1
MTSPYTAARWHAPLATTGLWALAAGAAVFWGLRLASPVQTVAAAAAAGRPAAAADTDAVARIFGVLPASSNAPVAPEAASRFALAGVVADPSSQGAALIAIDGKPPRPFRVGSRVGDGYVLQSVGLRSATLGARMDAPAAFTLQLPVKAPINVSVPPPIGVAPVLQAPVNVGGLPATMPAMAPAASALQPDGGAPMPQPGQGGATAQ